MFYTITVAVIPVVEDWCIMGLSTDHKIRKGISSFTKLKVS